MGNPITFSGVNGTTPTISAWYLGMIVYICGYINNISTSAQSEKIIASVEHYNVIPHPRTVIRVPGRYGQAYYTGTTCYIGVTSRDGRIDIVMTTSTSTSNVQAYFGSIVYYGSIA